MVHDQLLVAARLDEVGGPFTAGTTFNDRSTGRYKRERIFDRTDTPRRTDREALGGSPRIRFVSGTERAATAQPRQGHRAAGTLKEAVFGDDRPSAAESIEAAFVHRLHVLWNLHTRTRRAQHASANSRQGVAVTRRCYEACVAFENYDAHDSVGLAQCVARGDVSPVELLEETSARIDRVNGRLNAVVIPMLELGRDRARRGVPEGPFHGVPFLLKDLGSSYRGVLYQRGSRLFRGCVAESHGELVKRYLQAGLVIAGKTNTPELGLLPVTESALYGVAQNPWRYGRTAGGSSGGAAAAVASGIVPAAHGGDGGGSLRIPAACCGVFGFKPTRARIPCGSDCSETLFGFATEHVITRSVRDSAALLEATAGPEPTALYVAPPMAPEGLLTGSKRRLRIAFTADPFLPAAPHYDQTRAVEDAASLAESLGHHVEPARFRLDGPSFARAFMYHFGADVAAEFEAVKRARGRPVAAGEVEDMTFLFALLGRSVDAGAFAYHQRVLHTQARRVAEFFTRWDVLLSPTLGMPPPPHGMLRAQGPEEWLQRLAVGLGRPETLRAPGIVDAAAERTFAFVPYTPVFNVTGQPSASVPLFWNEDGLPIGTMVTGRFGEDHTVLQLCAQLEEARPWFHRRPPIHAGR